MKLDKTKTVLGLVFVSILFLSVNCYSVKVSVALFDSTTEYEVTDFPSMWMLFEGNITLDSASVAKAKSYRSIGPDSILSTYKLDDGSIGYVIPFSMGIEGKELVTLSLDDIDNIAVDPADDNFGDTGKMGSVSFLSDKSELFENTTDINGVSEYFFYEHATYFDSDSYQYLLLEDCSTPADSNSKIVVGTSAGNVTIFNDILLGSGTGDMWFRLDQHCSNNNIYNITITNLKLSSTSVFTLKSEDQWADSRYCSQYVGETEVTVTLAAESQINIVSRLYEPQWNIGQGRKRDLSISSTSWLNSINDSEILATRSSTGEPEAVVRASGWLTYQKLEEDLLNAIANWEGIDISGIRDYACSNGIAMWKYDNDAIVDAIHNEALEVATLTNDVQTFRDMLSERSISSSVFLIGTENDILGKKNGIPDTTLGSNGKFLEFLKDAAEKVYDTTNAAVASAKNTVSGVIQWGQDLISGVVDTGTGVVNGIVDTTGEVARNIVGAVATKEGVLNPMGFMDKIRANIKLILIIALILVAIIAVVIIVVIVNARKSAQAVTNSQLARNVKVEANTRDFL